jgi:endonuclease YncB( thermonuclease family)
MNRGSGWFAAMAVVIFSVTAFSGLFAVAGRKQTFTGEVGDAMCGRKHMEDEPAAECTRACVAHGSKFALIVGDKIYVLDTTDKTALAALDKQAGKTATVTGTLDGDTIEVISVTAK